MEAQDILILQMFDKNKKGEHNLHKTNISTDFRRFSYTHLLSFEGASG